MSEDGVFHNTMKHIFEEIFENKKLVKMLRLGRSDYNEVQYSLPEFWDTSEVRGINVLFRANRSSGNLSELWERSHNHEYVIWSNNQAIGLVRRLPKREFIYFIKPYSQNEIFVDNAIQSALSRFDNVKVRFEPGLLGEIR